ncbi:MAG: hypothetical protein IKN09_01310 [Clostridia bacterium]|nr:hypothetical protein [Clostridia bacterium]
MEQYSEQMEKIKRLIDAGVKNRNDILFKIIEDYDILKVFISYRDNIKVLDVLKGENMEDAISEETGLKHDEVIRAINYINRLSKAIDTELIQRAAQKHREKLNNQKSEESLFNYGVDGDRKSAYLKKKQDYRRQLDGFYNKYFESKRKGLLRVSNLRDNIVKVERKINYLDNPTSDRLILAEMYTDIGDYKQGYLIINDYSFNELNHEEQKVYVRSKTATMKARNKDYIKKLYDKGMSYAEIKDACERQPSEFRAGIIADGVENAYGACLSLKFIRDTYKEITEKEKENSEIVENER